MLIRNLRIKGFKLDVNLAAMLRNPADKPWSSSFVMHFKLDEAMSHVAVDDSVMEKQVETSPYEKKAKSCM